MHSKIQIMGQKVWTPAAEKSVGRLVMMLFGIPNLNIMSCMNSTALAEVKEAMGLYSMHLVNLSIVTSA